MPHRLRRAAILAAGGLALLVACSSQTDPEVTSHPASTEPLVPLGQMDCPSVDELQGAAGARSLPDGFRTTQTLADVQLYPDGPLVSFMQCTAGSENRPIDPLRATPGDGRPWLNVVEHLSEGAPSPTYPTSARAARQGAYQVPLTLLVFEFANGEQLSVLNWHPGVEDSLSEFDPTVDERHYLNGHMYCTYDPNNPPLRRSCSSQPDALSR